MAGTAMDDAERRALLDQLQMLRPDSDHPTAEFVRIFLPLPMHQLALREEVMLVRGERGAGKTSLFRLLSNRDTAKWLRLLFPDSKVQEVLWLEGFQEGGTGHPWTQTLDAFASTAEDSALRTAWTVHLACRLAESPEVVAAAGGHPLPKEVWTVWTEHRNEPAAWIATAIGRLGDLAGWLDRVEAGLTRANRTVTVSYDNLDRIGLYDSRIRARFTGTLLALWSSLANRYRRVRAKIFLREDLFVAAQAAFPDASKLGARSVCLDWHTQDLYRLVIRHMASLSGLMRDWLQRGTNGIALRESPVLGWLPPEGLPETGKSSQKALVDHLAGEQMGSGSNKGYTYRWIPAHLQDAHGRIVPRSFVNLVAYAARVAVQHSPRGKYDRLLHPQELSAALVETSKARVDELKEEHLVVARLQSLRGATVPLAKSDAAARLSETAGEPDGYATDGKAALEELVRIGVARVRPEGTIDVPDVFRHGFQIKRRGGVRTPR